SRTAYSGGVADGMYPGFFGDVSMKRWKQILMSVWPQRIWQQIAVVLVFLAAVPLLVLGTVLIRTSQQAVRVSVLRDHGELALRAAGQVNEFVQKPTELLGTVASIIGVSHTSPWQQETAIVELSLRYPMFRRIASVDLKGAEVAVSRLGSPHRNWSQETAFLRARSGERFMSPVRIVGGDTPVMTVAVPVISMGEIAGVLAAEVDLRGMWSIVDSIRVGQTGYACLLDNAGSVIAHPDKKMVMGHAGAIQSMLGPTGSHGEPSSRESQDEHGSRWLVSDASLPGTGWSMVIFQSANEAYAFSRTMMAQAWIFILLSIVVAFLTSMALARFMSRPLNMLLEGARRISRKDFESPLPIDRHDEIGQILGSFNAMTGQLKKAQQEEKLSVIGRAATSIVHELKNSLVLVDTYMQLLSVRGHQKEFMQEFVQVVPRELRAWKGMLQNMVDYARVYRFGMEPLEVNSLVRDVAILAKARIGQHDIDLAVETLQAQHVVRGNAEKLRQVILNLLTNAVESTPPQGTIRLATAMVAGPQGHAGWVAVCVDNTGPAIPPDKLGKIFEPFFTTKDGGLGLGLPICREIVERHGGFIRVVSRDGEGTSFRVNLPLEKGSTDDR
ncbi:MAG: HAMP domain-containing protein, partial [Candidatus Omnitrophica bacterium]|nr:HAMP domain-containing protein [Candidatus Omnitrophota bacterium]